ncbi:anthranilate synthase / indole-3-glycerol phosphate synthase [Wickerhamomyces ciferrii]|uniref:Multifunctional tryptophan biosynthesis protein n=1 Tax=Wickerhamomyces ciferrii (strain ATCC 14091 / BCRC 22168 / CBS 111 / JCM 3599 / NBRC 0793 / NRRL Y-1031 F-60-10) TaxID=1206466 RepID=K0KXX7_WICCF|nr:anthranilate synthase / indole-3-glycerol phosphate synthase [Wickerhamomyces ciferrii]CCH46922.1 anthranilate synthase / indole-3-glycerol phosphate synthase [Wickerhamomyces ciferrii]
MTRVVIIDNYDSFTWNLYEYLCQEGAQVEVFRNDKITVEEIEKLNPDTIVISPGPGHPKTDSGISRDTIKHFAGKKPIFGVCMGQQCIFEVFGGEVGYAGEIVHGKTSPINHDSKGMFQNVPQGIAVTRYHSLAGTKGTLPDDLEVTARTDSGIIMGVRHKKYTIEGVQFHPESILTEEGHRMIQNILNIRGGVWTDSPDVAIFTDKEVSQVNKKIKISILDEIYNKRKQDVEILSKTPGFTIEDLKKNFALGLAPPLVNFYDKLKENQPKTSLIAEVKRASPSKGPIDLQANSAEQGLHYAKAGASAISVLTEPHWFKGSIEDLRNVRQAFNSLSNRPAILRKEFIFSEYQILEARLNGADTVLLIVKMLDDELLKKLYKYSVELGMEPLVEVSSADEFKRSLVLNPKIIGVNNRDLHSFQVDLNTTSSLVSLTPKDTLLIALSGITNKDDAKKYKDEGVNGFLVGEALMRASDIKTFVQELLD